MSRGICSPIPFDHIRAVVFAQLVPTYSFSPAQVFLSFYQTHTCMFNPTCEIAWSCGRTEGDAAGAGDRESYHNSDPCWPLKRTFAVFAFKCGLLNRLMNNAWLSDTGLSSSYQSHLHFTLHSTIMSPKSNQQESPCYDPPPPFIPSNQS